MRLSKTKPASERPSLPRQSLARPARRLLLLVGDGTEFPPDGYDAVVGLDGAVPLGGRARFRLNVGHGLREFAKWGSLCVLLFPNADRFDVCGRNPAAAALYSELRGLAEADGGFEARLLSPSSVPSSPSATK